MSIHYEINSTTRVSTRILPFNVRNQLRNNGQCTVLHWVENVKSYFIPTEKATVQIHQTFRRLHGKFCLKSGPHCSSTMWNDQWAARYLFPYGCWKPQHCETHLEWFWVKIWYVMNTKEYRTLEIVTVSTNVKNSLFRFPVDERFIGVMTRGKLRVNRISASMCLWVQTAMI